MPFLHPPFHLTIATLLFTLPLACNDGKVKDTGATEQTPATTADTTDLAAQLDSLTNQMTELQNQMDQLSDSLAESEALNQQLLEETLSWEVIEHVCASEGMETTNIELGDSLGILYRKYISNNGTLVYASAVSNRDVVVLDETTGLLAFNCTPPAEAYTEIRFVLTLGYQR